MSKKMRGVLGFVLFLLVVIVVSGINNPNHQAKPQAPPTVKLPPAPAYGEKAWKVQDGVMTCHYQGEEVETLPGDTLFKLVVNHTHVGTSSLDSQAKPAEAVEATAELNGIKDQNQIPTGVKLRVFDHCGY